MDITLYKFPRVWGLPCMSPFCMKVEAYLRLRQLPHRTEVGDLRRAPRGLLPWVRLDGRVLGDSTLIVDHFEATHPQPLDAALSPAQRAQGWALSRTLEESTVWALRRQRFDAEAAWGDTAAVVRSILPLPLKPVGPAIVRRQMRAALRAQGLGRLPPEAHHDFACRDFDAAEALLAGKPFLFGERPSTFDLTLFAFVASFGCATARSPVTEHLLGLKGLLDHQRRLREQLYPELGDWMARPVRPDATAAPAVRDAVALGVSTI
ncbi:MAG: glutathione S-transferase family protein [Rubrivivax sp.]|nr:glutathione S-transferase family protein [Rubrivivax sp.]